MTTIVFKPAMLLAANTDSYSWINPYGGFWGIASGWQDTTIGSVATSAPGASSTVSITGGIADAFTNINGAGSAAQLSISQEVLFWGSVTVGGTLTLLASQSASTELDLDGGASVTAANLNLASGTTLEVANSSLLNAASGATLTDGFLLATSGARVQFGSLIANGFTGSHGLVYGTIGVDDGSSIEIGTAGGAALGAFTIDAGRSAAMSGTIDGNVVLNGTLAVEAGGSLFIDTNDPFGAAQSIAGAGTLTINENSQVTLGVADSAAIQFIGPAGTLILKVLPSATISGFVAGDIIELQAGLATGVSYLQTNSTLATLTLTKGGRVVGTLALSGNYASSQFHLRLDSFGNGFISVQTIGIAPNQPSTITGTAGSDTLIATANNQTLTGYGGNDVLSGGAFTGIDFKDTSADLNGSTISSFVASDLIDLTDMKSGTATVTYTAAVYSANASPVPGTLMVTDGTHTATVTLSTASPMPVGSWAVTTDGAAGSNLKYTALNVDAYAFLPSLGGLYSLASNWQDTTTAAVATQAPGYGNGVTVTGGAAYTDLMGSGVAASLTTSGSVLLLGNLNLGTVIPGISGALAQTGALALDGAASLLLAGSVSIGGMLEVGGHSTLTAAGSAMFTSTSASLLAINGSILQFGGIVANGNSSYPPSLIAVDANSSIEFGTTGSARTGALTIDNGVTASFGGTIDGNVVVNGTLAASGRSLAIGPFGTAANSVSGTGTLEIDSGGILTMAESDSAAIQFASASTGTLALGTILPTGTISGFAKGDAITLAEPVTTLRYSQSGNTGKLTLFDGAATVGTLSFAGSYVTLQFLLQVSASGTSSAITYAAAPNTTPGTQVSSGSDAFGWTNATGGVWSYAGNWTDTTTTRAAIIAPGGGDAVVIQDGVGASTSQIISGSGSAASLAIYAPASTVFTGAISVAGIFWVGSNPGGGVTLENGASFSVGTLDDYGSLLITGASLKVTGSVNSTEIVGLLGVVNGSAVSVIGSPDIGGGNLFVDATSSLEFGAAGGAMSGALTIDAGQAATQEENGLIAANLVLNGTLMVDNGTIEGFGAAIGSISGTGTLQIGSLIGTGRLTLRASDSAPLLFYHGSNPGFDTLEVQGPLPSGSISGFVIGDSIQIDQTVTSASFIQTNGTQGTLSLMNGAALVGTMTFLGNYSSNAFQVSVAASTGFATICLLPATNSSGTSPASTGYDGYRWTGASGGSWSLASNWLDTTTGTTPASVPSSLSYPVAITTNATIGGNGSAGNLTVSAAVQLTGSVTASYLTIAPGSGGSGSLTVAGGGTVISTFAAVTGLWAVDANSIGMAYYWLTLAGGTLLDMGGGIMGMNTLLTSGSANVIAVDANSIIEVGFSGPTARGALNLNAGTSTALAGSIYGNVVVTGTLLAGAGGSLFVDMTGTTASDPYSNTPTISGSGALWLTENSTLGIGAADSAAIRFVGSNATLMLAALPTGTISGFAAGDAIQVDQTVTGLGYQQASGILTLTNGAATVGQLTLAGSYTSSMFHLDAAPNSASATISLQTLGIATTQPTLIQGGVGPDVLTATANGQTLTGNGATETLSTGGFSSIDFKSITVFLNNYAITGFAPSDWLDFTDLKPSSWVGYSSGQLTVFDGVHAAIMSLSFATTPISGSFSATSDGAGGAKVAWS